MLELRRIVKDYNAGDTCVHALDEVNLTFRRSEFVSILGPSGCGKTTLLNIIGGLDRYTRGDLIINGRSTRSFRAYDWDAYRNNCVGFVFQNYNLIPHLSVLGNVELALTLSGKGKTERRAQAVAALEKVGLAEHLFKRPNQLSGGQMQRVAIARAIVNDPDILLADEPTGALDSKNSVQIVDLLKEISRDRLIIMVTHNDALAEKYSTRIIKLFDGKIEDDTSPYRPTEEERLEEIRYERERRGEPFVPEEYAPDRYPDPAQPLTESKKAERKERKRSVRRKNIANKTAAKQYKLEQKAQQRQQKREMRRTSMRFTTALGLSGRNLSTKKGRTALISFAGSIGIIGIALVLSIANGFTQYIDKLQTDTLVGFPITVSPRTVDLSGVTGTVGGHKETYENFPDDDRVQIYSRSLSGRIYFNDISDEYIAYVQRMQEKGWTNAVDFANTVNMNVIAKTSSSVPAYTLFSTSSSQGGISSTSNWTELVEEDNFVTSQYDVLAGTYPKEADELALIVDKHNRISAATIESLGLSFATDAEGKITFDDILSTCASFKVIVNDNLYTDGNPFVSPDADTVRSLYEDQSADGRKNISLHLTGILRIKEGTPLELYGTGIVHTKALTKAVIAANKNSAIITRQQEEIAVPYGEGKDLTSNREFYQAAGLDSSQVALWKHTVEEIRTFLTEKADFSPEQADALLQQIVEDPTLDFIEGDTDEIRAFKSAMSEAAQIISIVSKMITTAQNASLEALGAAERPTAIYIYPKDFDAKKKINTYLDAYNDAHPNAKVMYLDASAILADTMGNMVDIVSYILIAFSAVSLVVSGIMIAIITYVSVIERTKEIGVLRSIGARKKDISRVFNAETVLIGLIAGLIGILLAALLNFPINAILKAVIAANGGANLGIGNLAVLNPLHALVLIAVSVVLTLLSGFIPSQIAAKKDPVAALRAE